MQRSMCVAVIMALSGCATTPIPAEEADPVPIARLLAYQEALVDGATLIVTRDRGFTGSACNHATAVLMNLTNAPDQTCILLSSRAWITNQLDGFPLELGAVFLALHEHSFSSV
ncbi:hypothetical protein AO729_00850 [Pseudomonas sp. TTU2014-066ASC]|nr:hypothetical protein AO729_00850 [Pseudomonas sp. TTU2014-066ASC]